jgi:hypothetical protein
MEVGRALFDYVAEDSGKVNHHERVSADSGPVLRPWPVAGDNF